MHFSSSAPMCCSHCTQHGDKEQAKYFTIMLMWARTGAGGAVDVQGVCKSTVVRGEDDFPDGLLRITDCHDCVVYALAPLQYATVAGCSDCTVVRT